MLWEGLGALTSPQRRQLHLRKCLIEAPDVSLWPAWYLHGTCMAHSSSPGAAGLLEAQETWGRCQAWRGALPFSVNPGAEDGLRGELPGGGLGGSSVGWDRSRSHVERAQKCSFGSSILNWFESK